MRLRTFGLLLSSVVAIVIVTTVAPSTPAVAGGGGCQGSRQEVARTTVDIENICFTQTVVHVQPGATVVWTNRDRTPHAVTGAAFAWGSYDMINPAATASRRFDQSGVFPYFCYLHPGMVGAVVVGGGGVIGGSGEAFTPVASDPVSGPGSGDAVLGYVVGGTVVVSTLLLCIAHFVARRPASPEVA